jgi:hypothetical protein
MTDGNDTWRAIDLLRTGLQAVSKAQKIYVHTLLIYLFLVWGWQSISATGEVTIQVLGLSIRATGFWPITPLVITVLNLALVGSMNAIGPVWERLSDALKQAGKELYWTDLDTNKNVLDYFAFLKIHPEKPVQPKLPIPKPEQFRRFKLGGLLYPSLIAWGIYTTFFSLSRLPKTRAYVIYVLGCFGIQLLFSIRVFWKALCRFWGFRIEKTIY